MLKILTSLIQLIIRCIALLWLGMKKLVQLCVQAWRKHKNCQAKCQAKRQIKRQVSVNKNDD